MALHCCYEKLSGLIIVLVMINANLIQSSAIPDACANYCSSGGICYKNGDDSPKCFCSPRWTGVRCEVPQLEQQADATEQRNAQCNKLQPPFCKNDGICYLDTTGTPKFACHCRDPYVGANCQEISECDGYCANGGTCTLADELNNTGPTCTCPIGFDGTQCKKVVITTVTTQSTTTTTGAANGLCTLVGSSYCNSGTCVEVGDNVQCQCPSTVTGLQCEIPVGGTVSVPTTGTPPTGPTTSTPSGPTTSIPSGPTTSTPSGQTTGTTNPGQITGITCAQAPCRNNGRCYPNGNTYFCLCTSGFTGPNCDNTGK
jgi:hypothetical protein